MRRPTNDQIRDARGVVDWLRAKAQARVDRKLVDAAALVLFELGMEADR